jgi:LuxR family transcriptional regulator, maltose regulon positive regulatory protein
MICMSSARRTRWDGPLVRYVGFLRFERDGCRIFARNVCSNPREWDVPALFEHSLLAGTGFEGVAAGRGVVRRVGLFERLSAARAGGVVLVCAPAGSGKSVLVRSWLEAEGLGDRVAWVSVEPGERDGDRFWLSVIDALARVATSVERVAPAPGFRGEVVVERLLSELRSLQERVVLVIDDLHELRSSDAFEWLGLLLARMPSQLLVVLATRDDPRLGLHRLRMTGALTELRGPDLAFSPEEARELLETAGVGLSDAAEALLYERTEGWAAGLRLAAISLAGDPDPERFVTEFSGSERTVAGYLLAEVLQRQPAEVRDLLLRTSVLERVSGPLADHLTGGSGSERILQELEDANAFVTSLDAGRSWFRYHHLFADLLQLELRRVSSGEVGSLHSAAADWFEQEGYIVEAIRHAQAAGEWSWAARLLADNHQDLTLDGRAVTVRQLLRAFPDDVAAADGELSLVFANERLLDGEFEVSGAYVDRAQRLAGTVPLERRRRFDVELSEQRLLLARWRGDLGTVFDALQSLEAGLAVRTTGERRLNDTLRCVALGNLGIAELWSSRPDDARRHLEEALALARRADRPWAEIGCLGHLAIAGIWTGLSLSAGLELSEQAVRIADMHGWHEDPILVTALAAHAIALLWLGRFDEVERCLERAQRVLQPDGEPGTELIVHYARGLLRLAQGRLEEALEAFRAAERMQALLDGEHAFAVTGRARLIETQARMGELASARRALAETSEEARDTAEMREAAAVIHLAAGEPGQAVDVLAPVIDGGTPAIYRPSAITEALALNAAACARLGDRRAAEAWLERALELAEPEKIVLPFILAPIHELLDRLPRHRTAHATLLRVILDVLAGASPRAPGEGVTLLQELSHAELRVLRYLPSGLKATEIAAELGVSANTVRTHIRHIYTKLDAHDRNEAVARARELGLIGPSSHFR